MFVETRTTPAEVITEAWREVDHLFNGVLSGCATRQGHPTYITKTAIRNDLTGALAAMGLVRRLGDGNIPERTQFLLDRAVAAVANL